MHNSALYYQTNEHRTGGASSKMSASGARGKEFKSRANQIYHTLPTTRHRCNLEVWTLAQSRRDKHRSLVTPKRLLSKYNEDLFYLFIFWRRKN